MPTLSMVILMEIEKSKVYEEGCAAIRHYSLALRNIRAIAIAQGFAVLTTVFYLAKEGDFFLSAGASISGIALSTASRIFFISPKV